MSLCTFSKVRRCLDFLLGKGVRDITLIAIDVAALSKPLIDAKHWVWYQGYPHPEDHSGDFLVQGGYAGDSYGLLMVLPPLATQPTRIPNRGTCSSGTSSAYEILADE